MSHFSSQATEIVLELVNDITDLSELENLDFSRLVHERAENECSYNGECIEIIDALESDYHVHVDNETMEVELSDYNTVMRAYAFQLAVVAMHDAVSNAVSELKANIELYNEEVERLADHYNTDIDLDTCSNFGDCEYGWEAHNYETNDGVMIWSDEKVSCAYNPNLLEGESVAVSFKVLGCTYINTCFAPSK